MPDGPEVIAEAIPSKKKVTIDSHKKTSVTAEKTTVHILEMEDVLFHLNSAVLMPEAPESDKKKKEGEASEEQLTVTGVRVIALLFQFLEVNPNKLLLIAGHTDRSGDDKYNFELSDLRAKNVLHIVDGDRTAWAEICYEKHKIEDYQQILTHFNTKYKWPCNPGEIDNKWGTNTKSATEAFINYYNNEFADKKKNDYKDIYEVERLSTQLVIDTDKDSKKRWPIKMWEAVYLLYNEEIRQTIKLTPKKLDERRKEFVKFVDDNNKVVACGESFPISDDLKENYRSQKDRRVEILVFDKGKAPLITCPVKEDGKPKWDKVHKETECPLWHRLILKPVYIDPKDIHAVMYHMKFTYYNVLKKQVMDLPEGLEIDAYENGANKLQTVVSFSDGVYSVKVRYKSDLGDGKHKRIKFEFKAKDKWIYTKDKDSDPKIVKMDPTQNDQKVRKFKFEDRLKYYDLPEHWSSRNYWTHYDGDLTKGERYNEKKLRPTTGGKETKSDKPMIFNLDHIVLIDKDGRQNINDTSNTAPKDKNNSNALIALSDKSRYSMFYVKDEALLLFDQESANAPYFSNFEFKENLITKLPTDGQPRLIAFANDFYSVSDKRTTANDKFKADKHVLGARAAMVNDPDYHTHDRFNSSDNAPAGHGNLFFAPSTGNFELHYIHNGCLIKEPKKNDGLKIRSFLVVYWNGHFYKHQYNHATNPDDYDNIVMTDAHANTYATEGLKNAHERWEHKGYLIEPLTPPKKKEDCYIQIKPFFFFEAKKNNRGGKPKCEVKISNDNTAGSMGITTSHMYYKDYQIRDYLGVGKYKDIDGREYETLVVSHELGHAEGKDDEYAYHNGGIHASYQNAADGVFSQYYPGMPYQIDLGSMMKSNRAPRAKHLWGFTNWINKASKDPNKLKPFLNDTQFKIVNRFKSAGFAKTLQFEHHLGFKKSNPAKTSDYDYRDFTKPVKSEVKSTGTGNVTLSVYKLGEDEFAYAIPIGGMPMAYPFDGILPIYIKISLSFTKPTGEAKSWTDDVPVPGKPGYVWKRKIDWKDGMKKMINNLNNRFYLKNKNKDHPFRHTYLFFFPVLIEGAPTAVSHFDIKVHLDGKSKIHTSSGKTLKVSNNASKMWIVKYILGQNDGAVTAFFKRLFSIKDKPLKEHLKFIEEWHEEVMDEKDLDDDFTMVGK